VQDKLFVGIDVGKRSVDVAFTGDDEVRSYSNDDEGIASILEQLKDRSVASVVMEATGGYQRQLLAALLSNGYPAVAVNPRQVRDFAKAVGQLEKTDKIDARVLALFAERIRPAVRPLVDEAVQELKDWMQRRRQLVEMLTAEKNRLHQAKSGIRRDIQLHIDWLKKRLRETEKDLKGQMTGCPAWDARIDLIDEHRGLGRISAMVLIAEIPELGTLSRRKIAKLVGVAPLSRDSGQSKGKRSVWGGRAAARATLYMATLTATRFNPEIRDFYKRLLSRGKLKKVALVAAMRKLLTILNASLRDHLAQGQQTAPLA
jgi:transposase